MLNCQILVVSPVLWIFQVYNSKVRHSSWQEKKILPDNLISSFCSNSQHPNSISRFKRLDHLAGSMSGMELRQMAPLMASGYLLPRSVGQWWKTDCCFSIISLTNTVKGTWKEGCFMQEHEDSCGTDYDLP